MDINECYIRKSRFQSVRRCDYARLVSEVSDSSMEWRNKRGFAKK